MKRCKVYYSLLAICYLEVKADGSCITCFSNCSNCGVCQELSSTWLTTALMQVLLWTTCLLSSCATLSARVEDTGYLQRETVGYSCDESLLVL